ncbi:hypothetical protein SUGI_0800070 [Cryptomeria japonica]|uniref:uncharacterized protein LOC131046391 n=1 Tax=Cryptomeria japonica TaxID=3369 RepID=UPI0024148128|nr:uncharacterized protein LOC131046391 [Cryptomeria japonica]GLJ39219.1 hypothetical protein SUGI_0800070 [Cryptomeria japonica]
MGGFNWQSIREIRHFSHPHILELTSMVGGGQVKSYCRGCNKPIGEELAYHCNPCNFLLHINCSQIPEEINHPADSDHSLDLLSQPWEYGKLPSGCNACRQPITQGFSFHCTSCQLDLHPSCVNLPRKIENPNHPQHDFDLCFIPPYSNKAFKCNVCMKEDQSSWNYHFSICHYDAHVNCTQIPSLRETLLNHTSQDMTQAYVDRMGSYMPTSSGPHHLERGYSLPSRLFSFPRPSSLHSWSSFQMQQQQYQPFQNPYNTTGNMFVKPAITAIMQTVMGSIVQSFMNPGCGGGDGGWGLFKGFNSFGNSADIMESMFSYGFFLVSVIVPYQVMASLLVADTVSSKT